MKLKSKLYAGAVTHRRIRPRAHYLRYRAFWMLIDLDDLSSLHSGLRLFSYNRFNLISFHDADHGDTSGRSLRPQVEQSLAREGIAPPSGAIKLLCMPRVFGYVFNPLSIYFCYDASGALQAVLYEVRNTLGERHTYVLPVEDPSGVIEQQCPKTFYVSPFLDMDLRYRFRLTICDERVSVAVTASDRGGPQLAAALTGTARTLSDRTLARLLVGYPLLTLKVIFAIYWHAALMILRGFHVRSHSSLTAPPPRPFRSKG
jgi:DUF1365 family protein